LSEQPDVAVVAVTHARAAQIFYLGADAHVVGIQPIKTDLAGHADGIEDAPAGKAWADRHANWARQLPRDVTSLWAFVAGLCRTDCQRGQTAVGAQAPRFGNGRPAGGWRRPRHDRLLAADRAAISAASPRRAFWRQSVKV
jgi:ParB family transcriptional regulator, chromosome partitioning protein